MFVQIKATGWKFRDDTESVKETDGVVSFLKDHNVPFEQFSTPASKNFPEEKRVEWHESVSVVEIQCNTISDLQEYCNKYDCSFEIHDKYIIISF
jgi:hypothetical protein